MLADAAGGYPPLVPKRRVGTSQLAGPSSAVGAADSAERAAAEQARASRMADDSNIGVSQLLSVLGRRAAPGLQAPPSGRAMGFSSALLSLQLGEGGAGLSLGQQQLICLARLLLKKPTIVVLDEVIYHLNATIA